MGDVALDVQPEDVLGAGPGALRVVGELDAAGLAAAADLHLRLDDDGRRRSPRAIALGLLGGLGDAAREHGHAVRGQQVTGLVLEEIHEQAPYRPRNRAAARALDGGGQLSHQSGRPHATTTAAPPVAGATTVLAPPGALPTAGRRRRRTVAPPRVGRPSTIVPRAADDHRHPTSRAGAPHLPHRCGPLRPARCGRGAPRHRRSWRPTGSAARRRTRPTSRRAWASRATSRSPTPGWASSTATAARSPSTTGSTTAQRPAS